MQAINFVNIPFSMQTGRSVLINALLNAGGQLEICYINIEVCCPQEAWTFLHFSSSQS